MSISLIVYLSFIHWIADFVLQSDHIAKNKSKNNKVLFLHCFLYALTFTIMSLNWKFGLILGLIHFPIDYITSRINAKLWENKQIHWFFVSIGFDQFVHLVTILLVLKYIICI